MLSASPYHLRTNYGLTSTQMHRACQRAYEAMLREVATSRYQLVVDGEYYSGRRFAQLIYAPSSNRTSIDDYSYSARELAKELAGRVKRRFLRTRL